MIAVGLLTCGRLEYTRRTLESFSAQNPDARERFLLLHADDASGDPAILAIAAEHAFETITTPAVRSGGRLMRAALVAAAAARGADWILLLENDWEWARPFPWALFDHLHATRPDVYCLRLFGTHKGRNRQWPCATVHLGRARRAVTWSPLPGAPEPADVATIHWGAPPMVTRMAEALQLCTPPPPGEPVSSSDLAAIQASGKLTALVARVRDNVVYHIGLARTDAKPATPRRAVVRARSATRPSLYTPAWQETRRWSDDGAARCLDLAWQAVGVPGSLLDVGCGRGQLVTKAAARGIDAIGVDLSYAETDGPLRHADLRVPVDLDRTFDLVLCWEVAEHLPAEAAETLCDTLLRHVTPGGILLFTAATPGQGGDAHINEQPATYWRQRLAARGLEPDSLLTMALAQAWTQQAPRTPWYGKNLQAFRAPGAEATFTPLPVDPLPRVAIAMRTANRAPKPNYVGGTIRRLLAQGIDPASIHLCATHPDTRWLERELQGAAVTLHIPERPLTPNENGLAQIRVLTESAADWVLLLEDDLGFCADFLGSVQRWIVKAARPDRHVYRLFGFGLRPPKNKAIVAYDWKLQGLCGSQAVLLRMEDAQDFLGWADANLETWGGFRGNAKIAFDKLLASWALHRWPTEPGVVSHPLFVQHVGDVSSLHPRAIRMDNLFAGAGWRFAPQEARA
jgi:SAM-dependent methyltransferase